MIIKVTRTFRPFEGDLEWCPRETSKQALSLIGLCQGDPSRALNKVTFHPQQRGLRAVIALLARRPINQRTFLLKCLKEKAE